MIYQLSRICADIRIALDEDAESRSLLSAGDSDTLTLNAIIRSKVCDAVRIVETAAPAHMLDGGHSFGSAVYWNADGYGGWTILPSDFMRLVVFKMACWERPVFTALSEGDEEYGLQFSRFKGLRGTPQSPVCAIVSRPEGLVLEFWGGRGEEDDVERAVYLPFPRIDENGGVEICGRCYRSVVCHAAALTAQAVGGTDAAQGLVETAKALLI